MKQRACWTLALIFAGARVGLAAGPPELRGLGFDETLEGEAVTAEALNRATLRGADVPVVARVLVAASDLAGEAEHRFDRLDERLERYRLKSVPVVLVFADRLPAPDALEAWRQLVHEVAARYRGRVKGYELPAFGAGSSTATDVAFALKVGAVQIRAVDPDALVIAGPLGAADVEWLQALYAEDTAVYIDAVAIAGADAAEAAVAAIQPLVERENPQATLIVTGLPLPEEPGAAGSAFLSWQLSHLGGKVTLTTYAAGSGSLTKVLPAAASLKDVLTADLVLIEDRTAALRLDVGDQDLTSAVPHSLLYDIGDFNTYLAYGPAPGPAGTLSIELNDPTGLKPRLRDPLANTATDGTNVWDARASRARVEAPLLDRPLLLQLSYGSDTARASRTDVSGSALPTVAEIVARHQQVQAAQDVRLKTYMAEARMETHFHPSATDPGVDVVTENRFYSDAQGSEWEERSFMLNGTHWGAKRPPFPLLQAEKVLSLPLDLRLSKDYRYRLAGVEQVEGREAYAVRFDPLDESRTLYRGTVWIDRANYARLKVQAVQTRLSAPIVSSEEIQFYAPEGDVDGEPVYLLSHFTSHQIYLIAGRNLLVERLVHFSEFKINSAEFDGKRAEARASDNIMYRDTDEGLRHYVKHGATRVVENHPTNSAKALALGTIIDPSFDNPLPVVGLNYLNFHFLGKDNQLAMLFGGVVAIANVQRPKALGHKIDASLDLFAIALSMNDQVFGQTGELKGQRVSDLPFSTGLNVGWQATPFQKLSAFYQFGFDAYSRAPETAPAFKPPNDTVTNGVGAGYEYRRAGYTLEGSGYHYWRAGWGPWGYPWQASAGDGQYDKYSASLSKDFFWGGVNKIHLNAAYFGGRDLDRFSAYQFGLFEENQIHGVPSGAVRLDELAMLRGSYSFDLFGLYGLDLFLDHAIGREPTHPGWQNITGIGLGFNLRGPKNTLIRGEFGRSFLPEFYSGAGSFVAQVTLFRLF